ncbi:MAG: hypothetical protein O3C44_11050 [Proteobacteria bacterium]|nr:hypothetical protein [Pseudomonadota bacterium]
MQVASLSGGICAVPHGLCAAGWSADADTVWSHLVGGRCGWDFSVNSGWTVAVSAAISINEE